MSKIAAGLLCVLVVTAGLGTAQNLAPSGGGSALTVEHAVPFGTIPGKLLLVGSYIVFVDEQQLNSSFVISKSSIDSLKVESSDVTIKTKEPITNRSGDATNLSFRISGGADPAVVNSWYGTGPMTTAGPNAATAAAAASTPANGSAARTYQVRHSHVFGDCRGNLIIALNQVSFESVSDVSHSRRWEYQAIEETKLSNPYELEIKPFAGDTYKLRFDGSGMDPAVHKNLVDRITSSRSVR